MREKFLYLIYSGHRSKCSPPDRVTEQDSSGHHSNEECCNHRSERASEREGEGATQRELRPRRNERERVFKVLRVLRRGDIFLHFKWNLSLKETSSNWNLKTSSNFECSMPSLHVQAGRQKFKWNLSLEETRDEFTKKAIPLNCF